MVKIVKNVINIIFPLLILTSVCLIVIPAGFDTNVSYPLTIEGTLQNEVTFNYVLQVEIVEPSN